MIYVIFPAYNEEEAIGDALAALFEAARGNEENYYAIVVDDGSTDATARAAEAAALGAGKKYNVTILRHGQNRGLGAALRTGIYYCLDRAADSDCIVTLDADNTHPPKLIPQMVARLGERFDLVIASRFRRGAALHGVPPHRRLLSSAGRLLFQTLFYIPGARDYTCCFRAYGVPMLRKARAVYGEEFCAARGFEAVVDLLLRLRQLGVRAAEVPLELHYERRGNRSKMQVFKTTRRTLWLLSKRFLERMGKYSKTRVARRLQAAPRAEAAAT